MTVDTYKIRTYKIRNVKKFCHFLISHRNGS